MGMPCGKIPTQPKVEKMAFEILEEKLRGKPGNGKSCKRKLRASSEDEQSRKSRRLQTTQCSGCGENRPVKTRVATKLPWMRRTASKQDDKYVVCDKCYHHHMNCAPCAGCGENRHVNTRVATKLPWMRRTA